jgi:hypothetical protein
MGGTGSSGSCWTNRTQHTWPSWVRQHAAPLCAQLMHAGVRLARWPAAVERRLSPASLRYGRVLSCSVLCCAVYAEL